MEYLKNPYFFSALLLFSIVYYSASLMLFYFPFGGALHDHIGGDLFKNNLYEEELTIFVIPGHKKYFSNFYALQDFSYSMHTIPFQENGKLRYKYSLKNKLYFDNGFYINKTVSEFSQSEFSPSKVIRIKQLKPVKIDAEERKHIRNFKLYFALILFIDCVVFLTFIGLLIFNLFNFRWKLFLILKMALSLAILYVLFNYIYFAIGYFYNLLSV